MTSRTYFGRTRTGTIFRTVYAAMCEQGLDPAGLAKQLGWAEKRVRQLLDPGLGIRMDEAQTALDALGKRVTLSVDDAA